MNWWGIKMGRSGYFIYNETEERSVYTGGFGANPNPARQFVKHYANWLELSFIAKAEPSFVGRIQAEKELKICEDKLDRWSRRKDFIMEEALPEVVKLRKAWNQEGVPDRWCK